MATKLPVDKELSFLLWGITIFPLGITLLTELNKTKLIWYVRVVDFFDLTIIAPFFLIALITIHRIVYKDWLLLSAYFSIGLIGVFMYGHAMHVTGNAINTYSTEIQAYKSLIPADTYELIYFFDEFLGHILLYGALFALVGLWSFEYKVEKAGISNIAICGTLFGFSYAVALIESSQPWFSILIIIWLMVCNFWKAKKESRSIIHLWKFNPMTRFAISATIALLCGQVIFVIIFGGFIQPSHFLF